MTETAATLPATFNDFLGNSASIDHLRAAIAAGRLPHSLILSGPAGAGKYTLALMLAMAVECERQPRELRSFSQALGSSGQSLASFCGVCHNCTRIASAANLEDDRTFHRLLGARNVLVVVLHGILDALAIGACGSKRWRITGRGRIQRLCLKQMGAGRAELRIEVGALRLAARTQRGSGNHYHAEQLVHG